VRGAKLEATGRFQSIHSTETLANKTSKPGDLTEVRVPVRFKCQRSAPRDLAASRLQLASCGEQICFGIFPTQLNAEGGEIHNDQS
jgi:hypothetical protein